MEIHFYQTIKRSFPVALLLSAQAFAVLAQSSEPQLAKEREVLLTVSVTDKRGYPFKGMKPEHFKITGDKQPQEISSLSDQDEPVSVAFLIDTSGSMRGPIEGTTNLHFIINGIRDFLQISHEANEYAMLGFNKEVRLLLDWTPDGKKIEGALAKLALEPVQGQTALFDACHQGLELMRRSSHRKRVVILLSDGSDTSSKDSWHRKAREEIRKSDSIFFSINTDVLYLAEQSRQSILNPRIGTFAVENQRGRDVLEELSKDSGGVAFSPRNFAEVNGALELINLLLRNQYVIGIKANHVDGKWHEVKIEIKLPPNAPRELKYPVVKYRAGYFGPTARD